MPVELLTLLEVAGMDFEPQPLDVSGTGLASPWYVARYSWEVEPRLGYRLAKTGLNPEDSQMVDLFLDSGSPPTVDIFDVRVLGVSQASIDTKAE